MQIASGDFTEQYFPLRAFTAQAWVRYQIPLWNPYLYGGQPALADIQSGALYPPHVLEALLLGWGGPLLGYEIGFPLWALEWQVILHFSWGAVGTYLYARYRFRRSHISQRLARVGGVVTSLVFTYSGYLTGFPVQQLTILQVSAWLPWILWGLDITLTHTIHYSLRTTHHFAYVARTLIQSLPYLTLTALAFALAILAGHPQTVMYIFYLTLVYTLFITWRNFKSVNNKNKGSWPYQLITSLILWGGIILQGVIISAAQLLPTLEFISHSVRAELSYEAVSAGLPLSELVSILYPGYFGGSPQYVGIASLVLIALALAFALAHYRISKQHPTTKPFYNFAPHILFLGGCGLNQPTFGLW